MEPKTKVQAADGKQELLITREFDLPVDLLFKAHADPAIIEQWMSNPYATLKVVKLENHPHGSWQYQSTDPSGNIVFQANGTIHDFIPDKKIVRTFQMDNAPFDAQLEFLEFESLSSETSKLSMHIIYRSVELRDQMVQMGMVPGINMAHDHLQEIVGKLK